MSPFFLLITAYKNDILFTVKLNLTKPKTANCETKSKSSQDGSHQFHHKTSLAPIQHEENIKLQFSSKDCRLASSASRTSGAILDASSRPDKSVVPSNSVFNTCFISGPFPNHFQTFGINTKHVFEFPKIFNERCPLNFRYDMSCYNHLASLT